jgi:hypothetical protein
LSVFNTMQDPLPCDPKPSGEGSSPAAPRNDSLQGLLRSLLSDANAYCRATIQTFLFSVWRKVFATISA